MFDEFDRHLSNFTESVARSISRRQIMTRTVKGVIVTVAGTALGTLVNMKAAFAVSCTCDWYGGSGNANCPSHPGCGGAGCPSGCTPCTGDHSKGIYNCNNGYYSCGWISGSWVSCTGLGICGNGSRICTDCKCPDCSYVCTCLSQCTCCNCCTPQDVEQEMKRLKALAINTKYLPSI
jgi:hypothetical protein